MNYRPLLLALSTLLPLQSQVLITQYYEGFSNNKFLEITNTGSSAVDLSSYTLARFINAGAEEWKTGGSPNAIEPLSGSLEAGASFVFSNGGASTPFGARRANLVSEIITFNGDDSMVLYSSTDTIPANIADAFSVIVDADNITVVRKTTDQGYDLNSGSTYADFPAVWETLELDDANNAAIGDDAFIGSSDLGSSLPIVTFTDLSAALSEDSGTVDMVLQIEQPDGQEVSVDVVFFQANSTASLGEISNYTTQTVTFPAGSLSGDTQTVTVTLADDSDIEGTDQAIFQLDNLQTTGTAILGGAKVFTLSILDDDTAIPPLYISEIADPSDNSGDVNGRFIEIYNPTADDVDLFNGDWNILVYFNGNTSSQSIPLSGIIPAGGTYVIANNQLEFETAYPTAPAPNQTSGSINSNGNETFELRFGGGASTGVVVDIYGVVGTNGEGENFEFLDSQATRASTVTGPNATFTIGEWVITPADFSMMTPGTLTGGTPPTTGAPMILSLDVDRATGGSSMVVTNLGTATYNIETSADLNDTDAWAVLASGFTETDNADGTVTFSFTDAVIPSSPKRFYRINLAP